MEHQKICPYPGLRPFNEDESIYFKGREEHIDKIISQLQEKKFLMVTGASGDGKSSIIYAGLIPRARAGFFKARYNNWLVADLKPERAPLKNLANSLTNFIKIKDAKAIEEELSYGFSSLVKLYKESENYLDVDAASYKNANEEEKQNLKNKSGNLLILIDQFEELFTNAENFNKGKPSVEAITLINLIIETTRIAEKENLPVYIVCTMRSDYVGDCAAFKGLPELIVYSQFFVPRLKRNEIHRAILEPAKLSGNKINNRLTEKLINESGDGLDQLPILQHALNRIWKAHVDDDSPEMDLLHYAKAGGMDAGLLPEEQKNIFEQWYEKQTPFKQQLLEHTSLNNVLNFHARELFETAVDYCRSRIKEEIDKKEAQEILQKIFTCLTKINDNRAVRNRSTVLEIKQILGEKVNTSLIEGLVNVFRLPGNTLLKPFISAAHSPLEKAGGGALNDNDILDITHESLIRNWTELTEWTKHDHENVLVLNDFRKQVERWEEKKRSKDYLLTIGSLSYFKTWYEAVKPNAYLIAKYDESNLSPEQKVNTAKQFLQSATEYLQISDATIKRKRRTVFSIAAAIAVVLIGFTSFAFMERNKAVSQEKIANEKTSEALTSAETAKLAEEKAKIAKNNALTEKLKAQQNEKEAMEAKQQSDKFAVAAMDARSISEIEKKNAMYQMDVAKTEKNRADVQMQTAKEEKEKAETAEQKANRLKMLALAQTLALKAPEEKSQKAVQYALQAYKFNKKFGGREDDPAIYEALRKTYETLAPDKNILLSSQNELYGEPKAIFSSGDTIITIWKSSKYVLKEGITGIASAVIDKWVNNKLISSESLDFSKSQLDAVLLDPVGKYFLAGYEDNDLFFSHLFSQGDKIGYDKTLLKGHKASVRAAALSPDGKHLATGGKDSMIFIWNIEKETPVLEKSQKMWSEVKSLIYSDTGDTLIFLHDKTVGFWDMPVNSFCYSSKGAFPEIQKVFVSMALNRVTNVLYVGSTDGLIQFIDPAKNYFPEHNEPVNTIFNTSKTNEINIGLRLGLVAQLKSSIENLVFNKDYSLLAASASNRTLFVFETGEIKISVPLLTDYQNTSPRIKPDTINTLHPKFTFSSPTQMNKIIEIKNINSKIRSITFSSDNKLLVGCADKTIRQWETSSSIIADKLCGLLVNNIPRMSWTDFIGENIPYEYTCENLGEYDYNREREKPKNIKK